MKTSQDLITELIERLLKAASDHGRLDEVIARSVETEFRRDFNGAEYYVKERTELNLEQKRQAVVSAYLNDRPVDQIIRENGISRATLYRYLKR
mgnify:CR=1 FL=1